MKIILTGLIGLCLGACASLPKTAEKTPPTSNGLSAQTLAPGACGLFVWTAGQDRRFILFSQASTKAGLWNHSGEDIKLSIIDHSGAPAEQQFPLTNYQAENGAKLTLNLQNRQPITDGTRFKTGTLKVETPETWDRVIPIAGLSACQP